MLARILGKDWYADVDQMRSAIQARRAFNVIHMPTGEKFDVFPAVDDFADQQLERTSELVLGLPDGEVRAPVVSAEDILLAKLRWYADGGEVSDRQWSDITGLLAANSGLDFDYLNVWAIRLRVSKLLARAIEQSKA